MVHQIGMGYGIWESLAHLAGNRLGGHEKVWVTGVYGLSQVWIKTEVTVPATFSRGSYPDPLSASAKFVRKELVYPQPMQERLVYHCSHT